MLQGIRGGYSAPPTVVLKEFGAGKSDLYVASPECQMPETSLGFFTFIFFKSAGELRPGGNQFAISAHTAYVLWRIPAQHSTWFSK